MNNKIIFIGGIHGVGKTTLCKKACNILDINYLSASKVMNWSKLNNNKKNKEVRDINYNQNLLIKGLNEFIKDNSTYLLEGHFCLLNNNKDIINIPNETFQLIKPHLIIIITENIQIIKSRLEKRDNLEYDIKLLNKMQEIEISHAKSIANQLNIDYIESENSEFLNQLAMIKDYINK